MESSVLYRFFSNKSDQLEKQTALRWMLDPANEPSMVEWLRTNPDIIADYTTETGEEVEVTWQALRLDLKKQMIDSVKEPKAKVLKVELKWPAFIKKPVSIAIPIVLIAFVLLLLKFCHHDKTLDSNLAEYGSDIVVEKNKSDTVHTIFLEDGTNIRLSPNATFAYPTHFKEDKREVSLKGDATIDVALDNAKPFFVYTGNIIGRCTGGNFMIQNNLDAKLVNISDNRGRILVYNKDTSTSRQFEQSLPYSKNGVLLRPNRMAVYSISNNEFHTTLNPYAQPIASLGGRDCILDVSLTKLGVVMDRIGHIYGVDIMLESEDLNKCFFSGKLKYATLYETLADVCSNVDATYEIFGSSVLIRGKGCRQH